MAAGRIIGIGLFLVLSLPASAGAQCHLKGDFHGAVDQEGARAAVQRGDAAPFEQILKRARPQIEGEIVGQVLEQHRGAWLYEFRVVRGGHVQYLHFDARSGRRVEVASCGS
jgi:uncharacterized membrane protein YkoI